MFSNQRIGRNFVWPRCGPALDDGKLIDFRQTCFPSSTQTQYVEVFGWSNYLFNTRVLLKKQSKENIRSIFSPAGLGYQHVPCDTTRVLTWIPRCEEGDQFNWKQKILHFLRIYIVTYNWSSWTSWIENRNISRFKFTTAQLLAPWLSFNLGQAHWCQRWNSQIGLECFILTKFCIIPCLWQKY